MAIAIGANGTQPLTPMAIGTIICTTYLIAIDPFYPFTQKTQVLLHHQKGVPRRTVSGQVQTPRE